MNWFRKSSDLKLSKVGNQLYVSPPPPAKKEFLAMLSLLRDAEKYDNAGDSEISESILKTLSEYINDYIESGKLIDTKKENKTI